MAFEDDVLFRIGVVEHPNNAAQISSMVAKVREASAKMGGAVGTAGDVAVSNANQIGDAINRLVSAMGALGVKASETARATARINASAGGDDGGRSGGSGGGSSGGSPAPGGSARRTSNHTRTAKAVADLENRVGDLGATADRAAARVSELITSALETMHRSSLFRNIRCVFTDGNHGRATQKIRISTRTENSWETLMARMLKTAFRNYSDIQWEIAAGTQIITTVRNRNWRFLHGDAIRYQGGIGGLNIPAQKAVKSWNEAIPCYHTVFGHWHQYLRDRHWTCNGSSIGYSEYALAGKFTYEPPQQALIVVDDAGIRQNTAIQLSSNMV